jgi:outer membrane biosynthesis protein TonB
MKYITASKNSLEAELGIELEFVEKLSIGGNVVFKMKIETLTKEIIKKLYNLTFVQFMVDVRKPNTTEPAEEEPKKTPPEEKTPEETPAEQPAAETKPTEKPKQPNQYSAL